MNFLPENWQLFIFLSSLSLSLKVTLFSKSSYLTVHIKINYEIACIGKFSEKKDEDVPRTIATAKMEPFVELVCSRQLISQKTPT